MSASTKKIVSKVTETTVIHKFDKKTFARLLIIQKSRNVDLEEVLEHELPPYTTIYCKPRRIIDKNFHVKNIYNNFKGTIIDQYVPHIYYGMVLLQKLPREFLTFVQISDHIIGHYWKINQRRIQSHIFITDHYREDSVKSIELKRQSSIWLLRVKTINREQRVPLQLKRF